MERRRGGPTGSTPRNSLPPSPSLLQRARETWRRIQSGQVWTGCSPFDRAK